MRLTTELIRKHPRPTTGQTLLWDDLVRGYGIRITPNKVSHVVQWRESGNRKPRFGIGTWPELSVERARILARTKLAEVTVTGRGSRQALRFAMREWQAHQLKLAVWRPRYADRVESIITNYVEATPTERTQVTPTTLAAAQSLGSKPIGDIARGDVLALADSLRPGTAEGVMAILSSFFGWAYERELVQGNPARNRLRVTGGRNIRSRKLTDAEVRRLWTAFAAEGDPHVGAFEILLLTGARRREVTRMRWEEVDLEAGTWTLPAERRKNGQRDPEPFKITLAPRAIEVLQRAPRLQGNEHVFWGRRDKGAYEFQHALVDRVDAAAKVNDWRLHDLRRYMRSGLAKLGVSQVVAELCLGHRTPLAGLVGVYDVHDYAEEKREAWLAWAQYLQGAVLT